MKKSIKYLFPLVFLMSCINLYAQSSNQVWSTQRANAWYTQHKWISGADFIPSTAVNQLEMWQKDTFDPQTIDRELGWAENIGFNTMRVFLHSLAWKEDPVGFKQRVSQYLSIAAKHHIQTIFVFFDDCWNSHPQEGTQPAPRIGIHNSEWVQDPGIPAYKDSAYFPELKKYITDVIRYFAHDKRVLLWDLYNEPGNSDKANSSFPLLKNVFQWARAAHPDQPISAGLWDWNLEKLNKFQVANSDIITYHDYEAPIWHLRVIRILKSFGRPLICTEYMARPRDSRFSNIMPMLKDENVGAINWGLVTGKTNTKYAWDTPMPDGKDPKVWFHDIFHKDGRPYLQDEIDLIKKLNGIQ
jgi:hypothetical protein